MGALELEPNALDNTVARVHLDDPENLLELWSRPLRRLPRFSRFAEELAIHEESLIANRRTYISCTSSIRCRSFRISHSLDYLSLGHTLAPLTI